MENLGTLRENLLKYIKKKFATRRNVAEIAEDIVHRAFMDVQNSPGFTSEMYNFGYMSKAVLRRAYKVFHKHDREAALLTDFESAEPLISEDSFVQEVEAALDTAAIFASLQTLKQIERLIITERYYNDFSFRKISETHGIKLNTVLSHHRRALEKLRPHLAHHFMM
ncbi:MAG: sigma-70 family RNA polymerase sigma factor [Defluviitaleaceae bacterium]|nr:sigma-70 family RNA polymerase sigma factor [Defluviitaleaceae bacterium]